MTSERRRGHIRSGERPHERVQPGAPRSGALHANGYELPALGPELIQVLDRLRPLPPIRSLLIVDVPHQGGPMIQLGDQLEVFEASPASPSRSRQPPDCGPPWILEPDQLVRGNGCAVCPLS